MVNALTTITLHSTKLKEYEIVEVFLMIPLFYISDYESFDTNVGFKQNKLSKKTWTNKQYWDDRVPNGGTDELGNELESILGGKSFIKSLGPSLHLLPVKPHVRVNFTWQVK